MSFIFFFLIGLFFVGCMIVEDLGMILVLAFTCIMLAILSIALLYAYSYEKEFESKNINAYYRAFLIGDIAVSIVLVILIISRVITSLF